MSKQTAVLQSCSETEVLRWGKGGRAASRLWWWEKRRARVPLWLHALYRHDFNSTGQGEKNSFWGRETNKCTATTSRERWNNLLIRRVGTISNETEPQFRQMKPDLKVINASVLTSTRGLENIRLSTCCLLEARHNLRVLTVKKKQFVTPCTFQILASDKKSLNLYKTFFFFFSPDVQYSRRYTFGNRDRSRDHRQSKESTAECQKKRVLPPQLREPPPRHRIYIQTYIFNFHTCKKTKSISHTVLWWFNSSLEIHFENHNKCHICTAD